MSRILRRPMFRGGQVIDSRGTGITSGLMDGGRVGYQKGDIVLGGDLYTQQDYTDFINKNFSAGRKTEGFAPALLNQMFDSEGNLKEEFTYQNIFGQAKGEKGKDAVSVYDTDLLSFADTGLIPGTKKKQFTSKRPLANLLKEDVTETIKESGAYGTGPESIYGPRGPQELGITTREQPDDSPDPNDPNNNNEQVTEVDAKTLMRQNAELFKELLNEGSKEKIKKARIQDLSDLGLDIFAKSQQEGATVGSTLGGAAKTLVGKDSRVDKAQAQIDKTDQTAMALAINDYIAGNRSKEQINLMKEKLGADFEQKIALIDYQNNKRTFVDLVGELGKGMSNARAIASAVQKAFGKVPVSLNEKQSEANLAADRENIGKYFILSDGTVKTVLESGGTLIEDIVYSPSGITIEG